ncbi:MAG: DoxX family protein [Nocardiopsaceae bacterium]|nr:DoxX family protein [Nocardiopsaceae bacterium]
MEFVVLIGRILFVILFLSSAVGHLTQGKAMAGYAASKGVPLSGPATLGSGVLMLLGALSVLLGIWADLGALLLVLFLVPTAFLMHAFWKEGDAGARQQEMIQFQKDLALAGAALIVFGTHAGGCDLGPTVTGPLFG